MKFANEHMTPEEQVAFAWKHRDHFVEVGRHNSMVIAVRRRGDGGVYRNAWAELAHLVEERV